MRFIVFSNDDEGKEMLKNLTRINKPLRITLDQMMKLIGQCDLLDPHQVNPEQVRLHARGVGGGDEMVSNGVQTTTSSSLYSGILPGVFSAFLTAVQRIFAGRH